TARKAMQASVPTSAMAMAVTAEVATDSVQFQENRLSGPVFFRLRFSADVGMKKPAALAGRPVMLQACRGLAPAKAKWLTAARRWRR
ncbi:hypothetical protein, partial [Delftia acidovorans]|uniref:hypothetical protein n=1 Tax=Delftia acidovorans TaxID=80866 RepID=UPI0035A029C7